MFYSVRGFTPSVGKGSFICDSAEVIGDVVIGSQSSIWFRTVIRGDVMPIRIGNQTNIQDGTIIHGTYNKCGVTIGDRVTVGHGVILHGCVVGDECLIGMGSLIMDQAVIPDQTIVGAGSLVVENSQFPSGHLILGRPAKPVRPLSQQEKEFLLKSAENYNHYMGWYLNSNEGTGVIK